jgi:hypothetical protein
MADLAKNCGFKELVRRGCLVFWAGLASWSRSLGGNGSGSDTDLVVGGMVGAGTIRGLRVGMDWGWLSIARLCLTPALVIGGLGRGGICIGVLAMEEAYIYIFWRKEGPCG